LNGALDPTVTFAIQFTVWRRAADERVQISHFFGVAPAAVGKPLDDRGQAAACAAATTESNVLIVTVPLLMATSQQLCDVSELGRRGYRRRFVGACRST
jgi:hypothetical protein